MEKKNTMLLTVIAVATLLVAVVGATFAYFSITASGNSTTVVNTQAQKLPTITMKAGKENFGISVTAEDMALNKPGARWAMYVDESSSSQNASSGKNADANLYHWSESEQKYNLFSISAGASTDENDTLTYECPVTITLTAKDKVEELESGDLILYLYSKGGDVLVSEPESGTASEEIDDKTGPLITDWENGTNSYLMEDDSKSSDHSNGNGCSSDRGCYDVSELFTQPNETKTLYTVVIVKSESLENEGTAVKASMKLVNSAEKDQSKLAGQNIQITLISKLAKGGCKVITKEAE